MPGDPDPQARLARGADSMTTPPWRTRSSRTIYQNPWLRLREDVVELPNGRTTVYGVVSTGLCVGVLPFLDADTVVLVRQYRYVAGRHTWEMPTGGVGPGERIEDAARRELAEESGYQAGRLEPVCVYHTSKSVMDETAHLFLAFDLTMSARAPEPDETESFEVRPHRFQEVLRMVDTGEIVDSTTIIAVLQAERHGAVRRPPPL
jgi:ADP-ribose pyrophosphatase